MGSPSEDPCLQEVSNPLLRQASLQNAQRSGMLKPGTLGPPSKVSPLEGGVMSAKAEKQRGRARHKKVPKAPWEEAAQCLRMMLSV